MERPKSSKKLGELLVDRGLITPVQLREALAQQRSSGQFLGAILVAAKAIAPTTLLEVLSHHFGIPHETLAPERVDWSVAKQFPTSAISDGKCFPIRADASTVTIAIVNPLDAWLLSGIERAAGNRRLVLVLVLEDDLRRTQEAYRLHALRALEAKLKDTDGPAN